MMNQDNRYPFSRWFRIAAALAAIALVSGCGGGGGGGSSDPPPPPPPPGGISITAALQQGDYWEFAANTETQTFAQNSGTSTTTDFGIFRVTAGAPTQVGGATVYPLTVTGKSTVGTINFAPRWTHIGFADGSVVGSTDGVTLRTIYNGSTTSGPAAGFFIAFGTNETVTAASTTFTGQYNSLSAVRAGHSTSSGGCQTILGTTICSDSSTRFTEQEYYKNGIGPIGYAVDIFYSSSGGGFFTSHTIKRTVEIVGTTLAAADGATIKAPPWTEVASMATARKDHTASVHAGEVYVFGGLNASNTGLNTVEIYNPASNTWRAGVSAPVALGFYKAKTVGNRTFLINQAVEVRIFNHGNNSWSTGRLAPFSDPSFDIDVWTDTATNKTFVLAISSNASPGRLDVWGYEVNENLWYVGNSLATTDHRWQAISVIGNSFYLAGGFNQSLTSSPVFSGTYRYNLASGVWTTSGLGTLRVPRYDARAVNLGGAMVLLGGRTASVNALRDVESYSVSASAWTALPRMLRARNHFAAVVLNGKIYAIGGISGDQTPIASVEVHTP